MSFERYILGSTKTKMNVHAFKAVLSEYLEGKKTGGECRTAIEAILTENNHGTAVILEAEDVTDITDTLDYITGGSNLTIKTRRMDEMYRCCVLAEVGVWYGTEASLRTRLNWSTPT